MQITFISPYSDITNLGIRTISAYLKQSGHRTRMIFMTDPYREDKESRQLYKNNMLDTMINLCGDSDIVGISLMTTHFEKAAQITQKIKDDLDMPVLWGGAHPTVRPRECLDYADIACIGEGENAILELLDKMEQCQRLEDTQNLWFKHGDTIVENASRPPVSNLSVYPMPDYSLKNSYIILKGEIKEMTSESLKMCMEARPISQIMGKITYQTITGRGCPHKCSYCINDNLKALHKKHATLRWKSVDHIIQELLWVKRNLPYVGAISFSDDCFFSRNMTEMESLCRLYKEKIGFPFYCLASPLAVTEQKMVLLVETGLTHLQMGIESGSERVLECYNRKHMSKEKTMEAARIINKYKDTVMPHYDFLIDNPYETNEDKLETLRYISKIPKPYYIYVNSLVLYPGTKLYQMAKSDGIIKDEKTEIYNKTWSRRDPNYLNLLFLLAKRGKLPRSLLRLLASRPLLAVFDNSLTQKIIKSMLSARKCIRALKQNVFSIFGASR